MESRLLNVEELAERLGVPTSWVYAAAAAERIPSILVGRYRRFDYRHVMAHLEAERLAERRAQPDAA